MVPETSKVGGSGALLITVIYPIGTMLEFKFS
jgi:hypothetical protein